MPYKRIKDSLPEFYHGVLPETFDKMVPEETLADCPNCPMSCSSREQLHDEEAKPFAPDTKCCTYHPDLPNYLVGGLLTDNDPSLSEGRERIRKKLRERIGLFPQGIYAPRMYKVMYDTGRLQGFGRSSSLRCPYYSTEAGGCTVWKYREAICATWFCKHIASDNGKALWNSVLDYLRHTQQAIVEFTLLEFGLPLDEPYGGDILIEDMDGTPLHAAEYNRRWGAWSGREEEFYIAAYELVRSLDAAKLAALTGVRQRMLLELINKAHSEIITIPGCLKVNPDTTALKQLSPDLYQITLSLPVHGKKKDMLYTVPVPSAVIEVFDGSRPTEQAWDSLSEDYGLELDDEILLALFHHNILVSV